MKLHDPSKSIREEVWDDFRVKFIWKVDRTFIYHFVREFIGTIILSVIVGSVFRLLTGDEIAAMIGLFFGASSMFGFNTAWEWQDGLRNDGANWADWLAGNGGILAAVFLILKLTS